VTRQRDLFPLSFFLKLYLYREEIGHTNKIDRKVAMELSSTIPMNSGLYCTLCGRHYLMAEDRCVICGGSLKPSQEVKKNG
jgi:rRNA maturation endonuclease Nob1